MQDLFSVYETTLSLHAPLQCWDELQKLWSLRGEQPPTVEQNKQVAESERYVFRAFCYRAEAVSITPPDKFVALILFRP